MISDSSVRSTEANVMAATSYRPTLSAPWKSSLRKQLVAQTTTNIITLVQQAWRYIGVEIDRKHSSRKEKLISAVIQRIHDEDAALGCMMLQRLRAVLQLLEQRSEFMNVNSTVTLTCNCCTTQRPQRYTVVRSARKVWYIQLSLEQDVPIRFDTNLAHYNQLDETQLVQSLPGVCSCCQQSVRDPIMLYTKDSFAELSDRMIHYHMQGTCYCWCEPKKAHYFCGSAVEFLALPGDGQCFAHYAAAVKELEPELHNTLTKDVFNIVVSYLV